MGALMLLPLLGGGGGVSQSGYSPVTVPGPTINQGPVQVAGSAQDAASWWNSTFVYRRYLNITEPGVSGRTLTPIHLYLTFDSGHCHRDSIRVMYYDNPGWRALPFQVWNTTYDATGNYILSTRVSFMVNVSLGATEQNYYIYYSKDYVGTVSYPDFYPFVYKTYTYSVLNLISYYDGNNYVVEMWDSSNKIWDDPRNVDTRWASDTGIIQSGTVTNVPYGTLNRYEVIRIEPNTNYDNNAFLGFYRIRSNYPLAVTAGSGHKNSNPALNDWYPNVDEFGNGLGTRFLIGGVSGFDSYYEGKYWIQAQQNGTKVWVWTASESLDTGWYFYNGTAVSSWPARLYAGEYISKKKVNYQTVLMANSTKPVAVRSGDVDAAYSRDIMGLYPAVTGRLVGEEFYTIDMGHSRDRTRITNVGSASATVTVYRNSGSGWTQIASQTISAGGHYDISPGVASDSNPEDVLHIVASSGARLYVEGIYNPNSITDHGDWIPTVNGYRFGLEFKVWGGTYGKIFLYAWENAEVTISGPNGATLYIPAGGATFFVPISSSPALYTVTSNTTIGVVRAARFSSSSPYGPSGDQGYGWMVPSYAPERDEVGLTYVASIERHLFEFDITVVDLDGAPVQGATVTLYWPNGTLWVDEQGRNRTDVTNSAGLVIFEGLNNITYEIHSSIDAATWLTTSYTHLWVTDESNHTITSSVTPVTITLKMASVYIHLDDLNGNSMDDTPDEDVYMRLCEGTNPNVYVHHAQTNSTGWLVFPRVPQNSYNLYARYAGPEQYNLFDYDTISLHASWSIDSSEFAGGSVVHSDWVLPLVTVQVHVYSWDNRGVHDAHVDLNVTPDNVNYIHVMTEVTDSDGDVTFTRMLNGTWAFNVWRYDDFNQKTWNNSVVANVQAPTTLNINLRLTSLIVKVITSNNPVVGATVSVLIDNQTLLAVGQTNSSGYVTFSWIRANMTSPLNYTYSVNVTKGNQANWTWVDADYSLTENVVILPPPQYSQRYTEISSSAGFEETYWYKNFTFYFDYYNLTSTLSGPPEQKNITYDATSWIHIGIYDGPTLVGQLTWTTSASLYIDQLYPPYGWEFRATVDPAHWKLNASASPYKLVISAHTDGYDDPQQFVLYLTVKEALTSFGSDTQLAFTEQYKNCTDHTFWLEDLSNGDLGNITALTVYNYSIRSGLTTIRSGYLVNNTDGTFTLPSSALDGLPVGTYTITIALDAPNFQGAEQDFTLTIVELPMKTVITSAADYNWAPLAHAFTFQYLIANDTNPSLADITVVVRWINPSTGEVAVTQEQTLTPLAGQYIYTFDRDIVPVGTWQVNITCSKDNYAAATGVETTLIVSEAPTTLTATGGVDTVTVDWGQQATFDIYYERVEDSAALTGASSTDNWTVSIIIRDNGDGHYSITADTNLAAGTYVLRVTLALDNHQSQTIDLTVVIRVPLQIVSPYSSAENPLETYWTHNFTVRVTLLDMSRTNTTIDGATVTYNWYLEYVVDQQGSLSGLGNGVYEVTLDAHDALPMSDLYSVTVSASMTGATPTTITVFVRINAVPNRIVLPQNYFEQYYADNFSVTYYWENTLDNTSITEVDTATIMVLGLGVNITTGVNLGNGWYNFTVDTRALGMTAKEQGTVYVIRIIMERAGYEAHELTAVIVFVRETPTALIIDEIGPVNWSDSFTVTAHLWDTAHNVLIDGPASVTLTAIGSDYSVTLNNDGTGTFTWTIDSDLWFNGTTTYVLSLEYTLANYVDGANATTVYIAPVPAVITPDVTQQDSITLTWGEEFSVRVNVNQAYKSLSSPIDNLPVTYHWQGTAVSGAFAGIGNGAYLVTVNSSEVVAGVYTLVVTASNLNYTFVEWSMAVNVSPVPTELVASETELSGVHGGASFTVYVTYRIAAGAAHAGRILVADSAFSDFAGGQTGTWDETQQAYKFIIDPSAVDPSLVPGDIVVTISAQLTNYSQATVRITLHVIADTSVSISNVQVEIDKSTTLYVSYRDETHGTMVPFDAVTSITLTTPNKVFTKDDFRVADDGRYYVVITASDIGPISSDAYQVTLSIEANGYRAWSDVAGEVRVIETQYQILGYRIPQSQIFLMLFMSAIFIGAVAITVAVRRWRIPYQIKQINKAVKAIESGKRASVENIKTMGQVISELLAPGLAELDLPAPTLEVVREEGLEEVFSEETEELLDELDALHAIGGEEEAPSEAAIEEELLAELERETEAAQAEEAPSEPEKAETPEEAHEESSPPEAPETERMPEQEAEQEAEEQATEEPTQAEPDESAEETGETEDVEGPHDESGPDEQGDLSSSSDTGETEPESDEDSSDVTYERSDADIESEAETETGEREFDDTSPDNE